MRAILPREEIPQPVRLWLQTVLGRYRVLSAPRVASSRTAVWQLSCSGQRYFFKLHYSRLVWRTEVYAYEHWAAAYEPYVPRLAAVYDGEHLQGVLTTALAGIPLKDSQLDEARVIDVYREAGRLCKRLHDLPAGTSFGLIGEQGLPVDYQGVSLGAGASDPVAFIRNNFLELLSEAQVLGGIEPDEFAQIESALEAMDVFRQEAPTIVNTDYTPGNWLVDQEGRLVGVIDLEHVFRNVMVDAFTRLIVADYPRGARAFFEGFGSNPLPGRPMQTRIVCLRHALYYVGRGIRLGNKEWVQRGKMIFHHLDRLVRLDSIAQQ